ncbi:MAG: type II toxin-antitoxin system HicA family toxin [Methylococcales bacterium]|jgi:hypothetical protein|nr:type II toxin-antitoxin system HicA family toxin [Methylococcales bacterium]MDP3837608.1 type II toxin-antitoxin system HicA family toxin [Methylococcales bacterium]
MNAKHKKTKSAIFAKPTPTSIEWSDIESLIIALGGNIKQNKGSRVRIDLNGYSLNIHSPHPQKEVKIYVVKLLREFLEKAGIQ